MDKKHYEDLPFCKRANINILFIGNSYTYYNDMPEMVQRLAEENGINARAFSVTCGAHKLYEYVRNNDEYTKQIDEFIKTHKFDICVLQEQSILPITDYDLFINGLTELVKKLNPFVKRFVLYETWGRKEGCPMLTELFTTNKDMTYNLANAYHKASRIVNAEVSYVGLNFYDVYTNNFEIELYDKDMTHPSYAGSCLAALTHYYSFFDTYPKKTESLSLTDQEMRIFKNTVLKKLSV